MIFGQIGAYGDINMDTGAFEPEGNLYKENKYWKTVPRLGTPGGAPQLQHGALGETYQLVSNGVTATIVEGADQPDAESCVFLHFRF